MKHIALNNPYLTESSTKLNYKYFIVFFCRITWTAGICSFSHAWTCHFIAGYFFGTFIHANPKQSFVMGFMYGLAYFGLGVSWVIISIHDHGQINYFLSGLITLGFISFLALYPALFALVYQWIAPQQNTPRAMLLLGSLWCITEWLRAHFLTGFPWLLIGNSQIDSPLKFLAPIVGLYGLSFMAVFLASLLAFAAIDNSKKRHYYLISLTLILLLPIALKNKQWTTIANEPITIGAVQANLSMRDKWDEALFWNLLKHYAKETDKLLGTQLIILPESAIPLPARYLNDYLKHLDTKATKANSALIMGILQPTDDNESHYYNALMTLGRASGTHYKQQLVPFGEYIPKPLRAINRLLGLPEPNTLPGAPSQALIKVLGHSVASLICYEIAYPNLLRQQMPEAEWVVSISDIGWFGQSFASYQQLQMSQMLSLLSGRFQVVVNNDGLSSVINASGDIVTGLPAFSAGLLKSEVYSAKGNTPWILYGEQPILLFCTIYLIFILILRLRQHRSQ